MAVSYSVRVYRNRIPPIFRRGGEGREWMSKVSVAMMDAAKATAPVGPPRMDRRPGKLRRSHSISPARAANQNAATFEITNNADHAEYVHDGTSRIYPSNKTRLALPPGNGFPAVYAKSVRGQKAKPWLDNACTAVAIRYGAVRVA